MLKLRKHFPTRKNRDKKRSSQINDFRNKNDLKESAKMFCLGRHEKILINIGMKKKGLVGGLTYQVPPIFE